MASPVPAEETPTPAVPDLSLFSLFPTVEEQVEGIAEAQTEDRQMAQQQIPIPASHVPDEVIGRALTSGGNNAHSIERVVAFFQKSPTGSAAASFMEKEFGEGGKGVKIAGQDYAVWFDKRGFRIAPGRSAFGPGSIHVTWVNTAVIVNKLLRDGMFATQDKIDAAPDNEFRELAAELWYLRQDLSEDARKLNHLPTVSRHFLGKGFPDDTKEIAELLKEPASRQQIVRELEAFIVEYNYNPDYLRFPKIHNPQELCNSINHLFAERERFEAVEGFAPVRASFITEDEIDHLLQRGSNISESKLRIYSYFVQGHNAKECADFLKKSYGEGGYGHQGYNENHGTKGLSLTRSDEESGYKGYDTVTLNWNQVQKRVRALIDGGQYLNVREKSYLPAYEKVTLARRIYHFYSIDPNRTNPQGSDMDAAVKKIRAMLDDPEQSKALYGDMAKIFAAVPLDSRENQLMEPILTDMTAFRRGEYSLFTPLPEAVLEAERQKKQAEKEAKRNAPAPQRTTSEAPPVSGDRLAAAARALAKKRPAAAQEDQDGQFSLFSTAEPVSLETEPPVPAPEIQPPVQDQAPEREQAPDADYFDGYKAIKEANPDSIVLYHTGDFYEMYGEDAKTAAALLGLNLTTRATAGDRVEMCGFPVRNLDTALLDKLRQDHAVTLTLYDADKEKHMAYTMQAVNAPARESPEAPTVESGLNSGQTVRKLYDHYFPIVKNLVLADTAYQNACRNSDRESAYLEGGEAVKRAAQAIQNRAFMRQYYDNNAFHNRLHQGIISETYPMLSQLQQEHEDGAAVPSDDATVTAEEAPLLKRLMDGAGIEYAQFVHDDGDVTFSFAESDRDTVEKLIAQLRAELSKAVAATYGKDTPKKPGRTKPELNYRTFAKMFPEIASGEYRYLRLEAGETMMPLHLQWIDSDVISIRHTYMQNGDIMCDPEMTFRVDREKGTLEPLTFRQDGAPWIYQEVYSEPGIIWFPKLSRALSSFTQQWMKNISQQRYQKREATVVRDGEDVCLTFDQDDRVVEPAPVPAAENALGDNSTVKEIYGHYAPMVKNLVLEDVANFKGSRAEAWLMMYCKQTQTPYSKLSKEEKHSLIKIVQKSKLAKSHSQRGKKRG